LHRHSLFAVLALASALASSCIANDTLKVPDTVPKCVGSVPGTMRVASYNVASGQKSSIDQIADYIGTFSPDIIALQEVNVGAAGGDGRDQPAVIADKLGYQKIYAATVTRGGIGTYGIALLSRYPILSVTRIDMRTQWEAEPRVIIDATVCAGDKPIRVLATHTDVWKPQPGFDQIAKLLAPHPSGPTLLIGDLNEQPTEAGPLELQGDSLHDLIGHFAEGPTFWSDDKRIDYVFADDTLNALATGGAIGQEKLSDHLPVWADFNLVKLQ